MKKRYAIMLSAVLALAFSCAKEQGTDVVKQKMTFRVNAEETLDPSVVKAALDASRNVTFAIGDQISVFDGVGNNPFEATSAGSAVEFSGSATAAEVYNVLSPYDAEATIAGNVITATIPKVQTAVLNGADPRALVAVARTTDKGEIHLKNVVGLLKVQVNTANSVREIQVAAGAALNVAIAGKIAITTPATAEAEPTYTLADTSPEGKVTCVTLVPPAGDDFLAVGTYYIGVLNKTYEGLTVAYVTAEKQLRARKGSANAVVERSKVLALGELGDGYGAGYSNISTTGNAILQAGEIVNVLLKKMATPSVTSAANDENTITRIEIKVNSLDGAAAEKTIHASGSADRYPIYAILRGTVLTLYTRGDNIKLGGGGGGSVLFRNFKALESIDAQHLRIGNTNTLFRLFANCSNLLEVDLSGLNTTNVTNMASVFANCSKLRNVNLTGWSTTNVTGTGNDTGFHTMFLSCGDLKEVHLGSAFKPNDGVFVTSMFNGAALNHGGTPCKVYCSDAMWNWLSAGLDGEHPLNTTTGFHLVRFTHITE